MYDSSNACHPQPMTAAVMMMMQQLHGQLYHVKKKDATVITIHAADSATYRLEYGKVIGE